MTATSPMFLLRGSKRTGYDGEYQEHVCRIFSGDDGQEQALIFVHRYCGRSHTNSERLQERYKTYVEEMTAKRARIQKEIEEASVVKVTLPTPEERQTELELVTAKRVALQTKLAGWIEDHQKMSPEASQRVINGSLCRIKSVEDSIAKLEKEENAFIDDNAWNKKIVASIYKQEENRNQKLSLVKHSLTQAHIYPFHDWKIQQTKPTFRDSGYEWTLHHIKDSTTTEAPVMPEEIEFYPYR